MNLKSFRCSLREKLKEQKLSLSTLASLSDLSEDTLRSIIYGKSQDIKLSTLLKIADVLHCSIDELINRNRYPQEVKKLFERILKLPKSSIKTIQTIITLEEKRLLQKSVYGKEIIPVFIPKGNMQDGMYYDGNVFESLDITNYPVKLKNETNYGIKIQTDYFEPIYYTNDIILISSGNTPKKSDIVIYVNNIGKIFIRQLTDFGLEPVGNYGELIPMKDIKNYTPLGIVIKTIREYDIEFFR